MMGSSIYLYALNAPGSTVMYPNIWIVLQEVRHGRKNPQHQNNVPIPAAYPKYCSSIPQSVADLPIVRSHLSPTLYSKFWAATRGFINKSFPHVPFIATISPHAPPTLELISKAFQRWYIEVSPGCVPTSSRTQTLGSNIGPNALKNHLKGI